MSNQSKATQHNEQQNNQLKRVLGAPDLVMLGLGAIVGTGIFVIPGTAAATTAGPALIFSFILAAIACVLSALCYAEFASRIPKAGGAYSYAETMFGGTVGWFVAWLLMAQYLLANASVASGWSGYVNGFLDGLGLGLPVALRASYNAENGTYVDLIAILITFAVTRLVVQGAKRALAWNSRMVFVKFLIIGLFVAVGVFFVEPANWQPIAPYGMDGVLAGSAIVFFAFLGFDSVATAAEEARHPQKDLPKGILGSLGIATVLYILVTLVLTGMVPYLELDVRDPVSFAMRYAGLDWVGAVISTGAILTLLTVLISMLYSFARLIFVISRNELLPDKLSEVHPVKETPANATLVAGTGAALLAGTVPLAQLAELANIVTLLIFFIMAAGLIKLRKEKGEPAEGEFRVPLVPMIPILSMLVCAYLMSQLSAPVWVLFLGWLALGTIVYFIYVRHQLKEN